DPNVDVKKSLSEPQRWNRYSYVMNNPVRFVDPNGKEAIPGELQAFDTTLGPNSVWGSFVKPALHIDDFSSAFSGFSSAPMTEKLMALGIGLIGLADIGANFLSPEKAPGVLLGENMVRVSAGAEKLGLSTFKETGVTFADTMAKNMSWLAD